MDDLGGAAAGTAFAAPSSPEASSSPSGIRAIRYDMSSFFQQTVEKHCELASVKEQSLSSRVFKFPGIDDHQLDETGFENKGNLADIASKILMKAPLWCKVYAMGSFASYLHFGTRGYQMEPKL